MPWPKVSELLDGKWNGHAGYGGISFMRKHVAKWIEAEIPRHWRSLSLNRRHDIRVTMFLKVAIRVTRVFAADVLHFLLSWKPVQKNQEKWPAMMYAVEHLNRWCSTVAWQRSGAAPPSESEPRMEVPSWRDSSFNTYNQCSSAVDWFSEMQCFAFQGLNFSRLSLQTDGRDTHPLPPVKRRAAYIDFNGKSLIW